MAPEVRWVLDGSTVYIYGGARRPCDSMDGSTVYIYVSGDKHSRQYIYGGGRIYKSAQCGHQPLWQGYVVLDMGGYGWLWQGSTGYGKGMENTTGRDKGMAGYGWL
nr:hypothetical protein MACL_00000606 [Theileria orientalis]